MPEQPSFHSIKLFNSLSDPNETYKGEGLCGSLRILFTNVLAKFRGKKLEDVNSMPLFGLTDDDEPQWSKESPPSQAQRPCLKLVDPLE